MSSVRIARMIMNDKAVRIWKRSCHVFKSYHAIRLDCLGKTTIKLSGQPVFRPGICVLPQ